MIHSDKNNLILANWLLVALCLIFAMIVIGGLTRLTNSGLSIIEWELFSGIFPPLNQKSWNEYFSLYKTIPQFELLNYNMTINEFKIIFYWEYGHRLLGRVIGLFTLVTVIYFHFFKKISKAYLIQCYVIFFLVVLQGFIGWYMVQSGLVNDITVSHYRLSLHLVLAMIIISIIFWLILSIKKKKSKNFFDIQKSNIPFLVLISLIFIQIIFGAFVSGLDAGRIYQTWPLMGYNYFPDDLNFKDIESFVNFDHHSLVQFYHRNLAYLITLYIFCIFFFILIRKIKKLYKPIFLVLFILLAQIVLGVFTLVTDLNIFLASAHQISSVLLILSTFNLYYSYIK